MSGIRSRRIEADYLKVGDEFEFLGTGWTGIDEKPNSQVTEKRYISDASSSQSITSYKWQSDFTGDQIQSDKAIEYIVNIGKELKTGADAETFYVKVDLDKPAANDAGFYARKFKVAIQVSEFPNNDGELGLSGSFLGLGDPVIGTFDTSTKTFVEGFDEKTLEFEYTATDAVSEISVTGITYDSSAHKFKNIPVGTTSFTFKDGTTKKTATVKDSWSVA